MTAHRLEAHPVHLDAHSSALVQPEFPQGAEAMQWYEDYARRSKADGAKGRLVAAHAFTEDWTAWEMHPAGDELVLCLEGRMLLVQELAEGTVARTELNAGDYAINPAGVWHTADVREPVRALFITAGIGTEHRPR
ncbi:cupin domain-containing protein [Aurantiacibacter suaedae]|uniref:cupin domain-containing protein n=1 Tax=Aurantiacibacter suaedae TaxID=2545755 RepID=UPI0010F5F7EA|nr:cupin domain-containing protein [Aurantiacibacter suaedae]